MRRLTDLTIDLGGTGPSAQPVVRNVTLNTPMTPGALGVVLELRGESQNPPLLELFDGAQRLGQVQGLGHPLAITLPGPLPLSARVTLTGWATGLEISASFYTGMDGAQPLPEGGVPLTLQLRQRATFTLGPGQSTLLAVQGLASLYRDGTSLGTVGEGPPLALQEPGFYLLTPLRGPVTLSRVGVGPAPPGSPAQVDALVLGEGETDGVVTPTAPLRYHLTVPAGAYLEVQVEASDPCRALLSGPGGDHAGGEAVTGRQTLVVAEATGGLYRLELSADAEAEVTVTRMIAVLTHPGEVVISSGGLGHGWLLPVTRGQRVTLGVHRPEGAVDRPRLSIGTRSGQMYALSGYYTRLQAVAPEADTLLLRADDQDVPYTDAIAFIATE
ncbi:hypothetical protein [Deinococcus sp. Leaf326]|uniref:hypothetical protein n=1 Tax=Deinococcus sp. Leaf326 TaxID=1736338 RepID=UPI0006F4E15C|nr:hypothetical protein [Deinococcus sp. Leaf326]KQR37737.1 hypothetical protein ASF71_14750 [Deinococcus sp. Leaf326]